MQTASCAGFASQSLLTGLGSVQFISNLVFVMSVLKEKVPPRCMLATFFIVVGNVILVVFGNKDSPKYSVTELAGLYRKDGMVAYMAMAYAGGKQWRLLQIILDVMHQPLHTSSNCSVLVNSTALAEMHCLVGIRAFIMQHTAETMSKATLLLTCTVANDAEKGYNYAFAINDACLAYHQQADIPVPQWYPCRTPCTCMAARQKS